MCFKKCNATTKTVLYELFYFSSTLTAVYLWKSAAVAVVVAAAVRAAAE